MKSRLLTYGLSLAVLCTAATLPSCKQTTDPIFTESTNERVDEAAKALLNRLTSAPNGWILELVPHSRAIYGAYTIGLKFSPKGEVLATNELSADPTKWTKSEYTIGKDMNLSINFDTYNPAIHIFSTPDTDLAGGSGDGFEGDYEFNLVSYESDDVIIVRGKKTNNHMRLVRASSDIDTYIASLVAMKAKVYNTESMNANKQDALVGNLGGKSQLVKLASNGLHYFSVLTEGEANEVIVSYIFTPTGIKLVGDIAGVTELTWDAEKGYYVAPSGETLIARKDPTYEAYARYLGEYTMKLADTNNTTFDVTFTEGGYREYIIKGLDFDIVATFDAEHDSFIILTQDVGKTADGLRNVLCGWDTKAGRLSWGNNIGLVSALIPGTSPEQYGLYDNGVWGANKADSFIMWHLNSEGAGAGECKVYTRSRFQKPVFIRK